MERLSSVKLFLLLSCCGSVKANIDGTVYLERGQRGIVSCPLVQSRQISPSDVLIMYWYYGSLSRTSLLISDFYGRVAPQNGIAEGVYDIDNEFSLVMENVTASDEGTYHCRVKPRGRMMEDGQVEVRDKVSPRRPHPTVIGCNQEHDADSCEVRVPHDSRLHNLTCVMEQVKPAVDLRWIHARPHGYTELEASHLIKSAPHLGSLENDIYSTSATIQVPLQDDDDAEYVCEAAGVVVGNRTRTRVLLKKSYPTTEGLDTTTTHGSTATHDSTATHENKGSTVTLGGGVVAARKDNTATRMTEVYDVMVAAVVMSTISLLCSVVCILFLCFVLKKQKKFVKATPGIYN